MARDPVEVRSEALDAHFDRALTELRNRGSGWRLLWDGKGGAIIERHAPESSATSGSGGE